MVGIALQIPARSLDGFPGGLLNGAGIALILIGVFVFGARFRNPSDPDSGASWLPSRDQDTK